MLIPSIDLKDHAVVQLVQGERLAIKDPHVLRWIRKFEKFPKVQGLVPVRCMALAWAMRLNGSPTGVVLRQVSQRQGLAPDRR